jgi:hypothetical protein
MSGKRDSNPRPSVWETDALPTELFPLKFVMSQIVKIDYTDKKIGEIILKSVKSKK